MKAGNVWKITKEGLKAQWPQRIIGIALITFLIIALFGLTFENGPTTDIPTDVVVLDTRYGNGSVSEAIIADLGTRDVIDIEHIYCAGTENALQKGLDDLKDGDVKAVLVLGANFTSDVERWVSLHKNGTAYMPTSLIGYLDGSNPTVSSAIQGDVQRSVQTVLFNEFGVSLAIRTVPVIEYGEGTDLRDFMAPGIAALLVFIMTMIPTMMATNELLRSGRPEITVGDRIAGQAFVTVVVGTVQVATIMLTLSLFSILDGDGLIWIFLLFMLLTLASTGLGLLIGHFVSGKGSASMALLPLLIYPAILLSGLMIPVSSVPGYLLPISYFFPLTYTIEGVRLAALSGFGLERIGVQIAALSVYALLTYSAAWWLALRERRRTEALQD